MTSMSNAPDTAPLMPIPPPPPAFCRKSVTAIMKCFASVVANALLDDFPAFGE